MWPWAKYWLRGIMADASMKGVIWCKRMDLGQSKKRETPNLGFLVYRGQVSEQHSVVCGGRGEMRRRETRRGQVRRGQVRRGQMNCGNEWKFLPIYMCNCRLRRPFRKNIGGSWYIYSSTCLNLCLKGVIASNCIPKGAQPLPLPIELLQQPLSTW